MAAARAADVGCAPAFVDDAADYSLTPRLGLGRVLLDYQALDQGDLKLEAGDVVVLTRQLGKDWFYGHLNARPEEAGLFPCSVVEVIQGSVVQPGPLILQRGASGRFAQQPVAPATGGSSSGGAGKPTTTAGAVSSVRVPLGPRAASAVAKFGGGRASAAPAAAAGGTAAAAAGRDSARSAPGAGDSFSDTGSDAGTDTASLRPDSSRATHTTGAGRPGQHTSSAGPAAPPGAATGAASHGLLQPREASSRHLGLLSMVGQRGGSGGGSLGPLAPAELGTLLSSSAAAAVAGARPLPSLAGDAEEAVVSVFVPYAERKLGLDGGLHSWYTVDVETSVRVVRVDKRFSELRAADAQLRALCPALFAASADDAGEGPADGRPGGAAAAAAASHAAGSPAAAPRQPQAAQQPRPIDVSLQDARLMAAKRTSACMESRRLAAQRYLQLAMAHPRVGPLLVAYLAGPLPGSAQERALGGGGGSEYGGSGSSPRDGSSGGALGSARGSAGAGSGSGGSARTGLTSTASGGSSGRRLLPSIPLSAVRNPSVPLPSGAGATAGGAGGGGSGAPTHPSFAPAPLPGPPPAPSLAAASSGLTLSAGPAAPPSAANNRRSARLAWTPGQLQQQLASGVGAASAAPAASPGGAGGAAAARVSPRGGGGGGGASVAGGAPLPPVPEHAHAGSGTSSFLSLGSAPEESEEGEEEGEEGEASGEGQAGDEEAAAPEAPLPPVYPLHVTCSHRPHVDPTAAGAGAATADVAISATSAAAVGLPAYLLMPQGCSAPFALDSLDAFDGLMEVGWSVIEHSPAEVATWSRGVAPSAVSFAARGDPLPGPPPLSAGVKAEEEGTPGEDGALRAALAVPAGAGPGEEDVPAACAAAWAARWPALPAAIDPAIPGAAATAGALVTPAEGGGAATASAAATAQQAAALTGALRFPRTGQQVTVSYTALVWDGGNTSGVVLECVPAATFHLGDSRDARLPAGLHAALRRVPIGGAATVVLGPDAAFGQRGVPARGIPQAAHLVYARLRLHAIAGPPRPMPAAQFGPGAGGEAGSGGGGEAAGKARLGLVVAAEPGGKLVDDEMLAMASAILGLGPGGSGGGKPSGGSRGINLGGGGGGRFAGRAAGERTVVLGAAPPDPGATPGGGSGPFSAGGAGGPMSPGHFNAGSGSAAAAAAAAAGGGGGGFAASGKGMRAEKRADGGISMPSPAEAEAALRAYLASLGQELPPSVGGDGGKKHKSKGSKSDTAAHGVSASGGGGVGGGFLRSLFGRGSASAGNSAGGGEGGAGEGDGASSAAAGGFGGLGLGSPAAGSVGGFEPGGGDPSAHQQQHHVGASGASTSSASAGATTSGGAAAGGSVLSRLFSKKAASGTSAGGPSAGSSGGAPLSPEGGPHHAAAASSLSARATSPPATLAAGVRLAAAAAAPPPPPPVRAAISPGASTGTRSAGSSGRPSPAAPSRH